MNSYSPVNKNFSSRYTNENALKTIDLEKNFGIASFFFSKKYFKYQKNRNRKCKEIMKRYDEFALII